MKLPNVALSIRQPWAWLILHGGKNRMLADVEATIAALRAELLALREERRDELRGVR